MTEQQSRIAELVARRKEQYPDLDVGSTNVKGGKRRRFSMTKTTGWNGNLSIGWIPGSRRVVIGEWVVSNLGQAVTLLRVLEMAIDEAYVRQIADALAGLEPNEPPISDGGRG